MENSNEGNNMVGACAICSTSTTSKCTTCYNIYYCSVNHQKQDWKRHKPQCRPFIIKSNEKFGRYIVASRDIKENEIILKESPIICGPMAEMDLACVGCLKKLDENYSLQCDYCGWPICQRECQNHPDHKAECEFTIKTRRCKIQDFNLSPHFEYLTIIRCLLLKTTDPQKWERLIQLESHQELRRNSAKWQHDFSSFELFMRKYFKTNKWSEEEIMQIFGIIQINSFAIHFPETPCIGIFDYASLFEHSCVPNVTEVFTEKNELILWSPFKIKKGTHLSIAYIGIRGETEIRRENLERIKFFKCECERCKDVTELGTFHSALKCIVTDCDGLVLPASFETYTQDWTCNKCSNILDNSYVRHILNEAGKASFMLDKTNMDSCWRFINLYSKYLSDQNYFICRVKLNLISFINGENDLESINNDQLDYYLKICKEMIDFYEKLTPVGVERFLAHLCYTMVVVINEKFSRSTDNSNDTLKNELKLSLKYVDYAMKYLKYQPKSFVEGNMFREAKKMKFFLRNLLRTLS